MKKFNAVACLVHEDEDISIPYIDPQIVCHKTAEGVIALSHIGRLTVEQIAHTVIETKHRVCFLLKL